MEVIQDDYLKEICSPGSYAVRYNDPLLILVLSPFINIYIGIINTISHVVENRSSLNTYVLYSLFFLVCCTYLSLPQWLEVHQEFGYTKRLWIFFE